MRDLQLELKTGIYGRGFRVLPLKYIFSYSNEAKGEPHLARGVSP